MTIATGARVGSYEIVSPLGSGGMGEVYRARDAKLGRDVALKVLPETFAATGERRARFEREAAILASLNHPNIAAIYGLEDSTTTHALVMELVEGPTLADRLVRGPLPLIDALGVARQLCDALEYAHERGIVHRDLKPANIKVTADAAVKVLDFGLAKAVAGESGSDLADAPTQTMMATGAGVLLGTAAYMAPEQAKGRAVDRRADIWAFGAVLFEMLCGTMPFPGESVTEILAGVIGHEPDWSRLPAETPLRVRALVQRCLRKDLRRRVQAIGDARIEIDEIVSGAIDLAVAVPTTGTRWQRVLPWALFGAAAVALVILGWAYRRPGGTTDQEPIVLQIAMPEVPKLHATGLFALSPDGRQLAFAAIGSDGVSRVWLRAMNALEMHPVEGTESVRSLLFWSPDGRQLAFDTGDRLRKVDLKSGGLQTICTLAVTGVGGSWNRDGTIIFGQFGGAIMQVTASGGTAMPLTVLDPAHGDIAHTAPTFLPDGRHFLYFRARGYSSVIAEGSLDVRPEAQDARVLAVTNRGAAYVQPTNSGSGRLLYLRDGILMAQAFDPDSLSVSGDAARLTTERVAVFFNYGQFSVSPTGPLVYRSVAPQASQLTWFDPQGNVIGTLGAAESYGTLAVSPDGTRALVSKVTPTAPRSAVWVLDLARGTSTRTELDPSIDNRRGVWSPDGTRMVFGSAHDGQMMDLYEKSVGGTDEARVLLKSNEWKTPLSWSPDGRFVLYATDGTDDLWVAPLDHGKPTPFLQTPFHQRDGAFSPDGRWVAYVSDESGRPEVYVRAFATDASGHALPAAGDKTIVSTGGGFHPVWSARGTALYYVNADGMLAAADVTTGAAFRVTPPGHSSSS